MTDLAAVKRTALAIERAHAARDAAIVAAVNGGARVVDVAAAAGLTRERVYQLVRTDPRCRHCGLPASWHSDIDNRCPDDGTPHPDAESPIGWKGE